MGRNKFFQEEILKESFGKDKSRKEIVKAFAKVMVKAMVKTMVKTKPLHLHLFTINKLMSIYQPKQKANELRSSKENSLNSYLSRKEVLYFWFVILVWL